MPWWCPTAAIPQRLAAAVFDRLLEQVSAIVWVDNASGDGLRALASRWPAERLHAIWLGDNQGIGAAQNRGMERALALGASHVLLMDDDSLPAPDMVPRLLAALAAHPQAAAVGACHVDPRRETGRTPFSVVAGGATALAGVFRRPAGLGSGPCDRLRLPDPRNRTAGGRLDAGRFLHRLGGHRMVPARPGQGLPDLWRVRGAAGTTPWVTGWYGCWGGKSPIMHRGGITIRHAISCSCYAHAEWVGCLNFIWCFVS